MSGSTVRGLRLIKNIQQYVQVKPNHWDTTTVLSKVKLDYVADGVIRGKFMIDTSMCNVSHYLHGGYIASLMDVLSIFSCLSNDGGKLSWSTSLYIQFLRAAKEGEEVSFESTPLRIGKGSVVEVTLKTSKTNDVVARGTVALVAAKSTFEIKTADALCQNLDGA